jgi:uncharacterized membrane protein YadS
MMIFRQQNCEGKASFPEFLLAFVGLATLNSLGLVPEFIIDTGNVLSRWCLVIAIAAVGVKTALNELVDVGWRAIILMLIETCFIGVFVLAGYMLFFNGSLG